MRHPLTMLAIVAVAAGIGFSAAPAKAASLPKLDAVGERAAAVESVGGYYRRWGYRPYRYWRPPYYGPRRYYGYPYYRRYYWGYPYWRRPYYGPRYWW